VAKSSNQPDPSNHSILWQRLLSAHDRVFTPASTTALKHIVIKLSIAGFAIHLALIFISRSLSNPPLIIQGVGHNYLTAISTPFSFILFYEVLTLIAALPASNTSSIAHQYEIVSLIFIRDVFKDIAAAKGMIVEHRLTEEAVPIVFDMWAALLMFFLVAVFQHVALKKISPKGSTERSQGLELFISQKKIITTGLAALLLIMAAYNIILFLTHIYRVLHLGIKSPLETPTTFYNDLFSVMIFTDVLVLILSLIVSGRYEMVFRNAAFVVSIILIRFSLTEPRPFGTLLALLAMLFGILTLLVFNFHASIHRDNPAT
jgi:hypothetical protein